MSSQFFSLFHLRRDDVGPARVGFTTPRALGKAHDRNRIRRRLREAVRHELANAPHSVDFVFHPRRNAAQAPQDDLRREVQRVFLACAR
jgi:ribonuclease P protein component